MIKKLHLQSILFVLISLLSFRMQAQDYKITGTVGDQVTGETIPGVTVMIDGTAKGNITGEDGSFEIVANSPEVNLVFKHISFKTKRVDVRCKPGTTNFIGLIALEPNMVMLGEVKILSSFVTERSTPVAISTITSKSIEQRSGNQDYPEILKMTPGIYATREGGGSGDDRLTLRGFQQENISLLLNGVPVSSMENGLVYWSNWTGLADATEAIQVQRGLGASRVAMNSVGGTINIITRSTIPEASGSFAYSLSDYGNRKASISLSTGKMKNGTSLLFLGSHTSGPGYVDATYVNSWAYFLSISRAFGKNHRLVLTAMGTPDRHGQRNYGMSQADFENYGVKYNKNWGEYNGRILSLSENFYHKPQINLNHYWNVSQKIFLATSAYVSFGKGGGRYAEAFNYGTAMWDIRKNNQVDFDAVFLANSTNQDSTRLADGSVEKGYSKNVLTNYMANHYWAGILSTMTLEAGPNVKITAGVHVRTFRSHVYEEIDDLMGGNFWIEQYAWSAAGVDGRQQIKKRGDIINVDNYSMINYGNLFGQVEYRRGRLTTFAAATLSGTHYRRKDPYNYPGNPLSEPVSKGGFDMKGGAGYKVGKHGSFYANIGFYSREPYYKFVYVNYSNAVAQNLVNEKITSAEAGYNFENDKITYRVNLYYTFWKDKSLLTNENIQLADNTLTRSLVRGLNAVHYGLESEISYQATQNFTLRSTLSLGSWKWQNDVSASIYNDNQVLVNSMQVYTKGLYVGDAPQTQVGLSAAYHTQAGLRFAADWVYYDRLYANFDPANRNNPNDRSQPYRIPAYALTDVYTGYDFRMKTFPVSVQLSCQNVFDKVCIIRGDDGAGHDLPGFSGFWSMGRTFNLSAKIRF